MTPFEAMERIKVRAARDRLYEHPDALHQEIVRRQWDNEAIVAFALERMMQGYDYDITYPGWDRLRTEE